jgi:hypothetical protein
MKKWSELTDKERAEAIAWIRRGASALGHKPALHDHLEAAANELESPTWDEEPDEK